MSDSRLKHLFDKYIANTISHEEEQELFDFIGSGSFDETTKQYLLKIYSKRSKGHTLSESQSNRILSSIIDSTESISRSKMSHWPLSRISWAAAILVVSSGIILFYTLSRGNKHNSSIVKNSPPALLKNDVAPGSNGAILKLSDGSQMVLDSNKKTTIKQGNTLVVNNAGTLKYVRGNELPDSAIAYNTVETQRGHQFSLTLEDGTKVWLNAASSISFPVVFNENLRDVKITGEVYFEVAKNKSKPFRVFVNGTTVEVLGTHFNINSYGDNGTVNTTLLEGSVKIFNGNNQKLLKPGDQAKVRKSGQMTVEDNINTEQIVAWKNNYFSFDNIDIKRVMMQLSRWYNVEVVYKREPGESVKFNGDISRSDNLSTVLKMLESTGEVIFSIEGNKVTVSM